MSFSRPKQVLYISFNLFSNHVCYTSTPQNAIEMTGGAINIPLKDGKSINIPVDRITYDPESGQVRLKTFYVDESLDYFPKDMRWNS